MKSIIKFYLIDQGERSGFWYGALYPKSPEESAAFLAMKFMARFSKYFLLNCEKG